MIQYITNYRKLVWYWRLVHNSSFSYILAKAYASCSAVCLGPLTYLLGVLRGIPSKTDKMGYFLYIS